MRHAGCRRPGPMASRTPREQWKCWHPPNKPESTFMKKAILPLIAFAALTFGIVSVVRSQPKREPTTPSSPPPVSPYPHTVAAVGLVETSTENIAIGTPLSDVVSEVLVVADQAVKAGDPLFRLDVRHLRAELAMRQAELRVAES